MCDSAVDAEPTIRIRSRRSAGLSIFSAAAFDDADDDDDDDDDDAADECISAVKDDDEVTVADGNRGIIDMPEDVDDNDVDVDVGAPEAGESIPIASELLDDDDDDDDDFDDDDEEEAVAVAAADGAVASMSTVRRPNGDLLDAPTPAATACGLACA